MKKTKKLLSAALVLLLALSLLSPLALAASADNVKQFENMTVFGDSIPCACGLPTSTSFGVAEGSYFDLVSQAIGAAPYTSYAFNGSCIDHVMYMLGLDVPEEDMAIAKYYLDNTAGAAPWSDYIRIADSGEVIESVTDSDLICLALGSNDIATVPIKFAMSKYEELTDSGMSTAEAIPQTVETFLKYFNMGLDYFFNGYPQILQKIRELNPTATILLIGAYNPYIKTSLIEGNEWFAIGNALSAGTQLQNTQLQIWAKQYNCTYVNEFAEGYYFPPQTIEYALEGNAMSTHPTYEGHARMAQKIIEALPMVETKLCTPKNAELRLEFGGIDAGRYKVEYKDLGWTIKDLETGMYVSLDGSNNIAQSEKPMVWGFDGGFFSLQTVSSGRFFGMPMYKVVKFYAAANEFGDLVSATGFTKADMFIAN